ncbi:MAG: peptide ABC transporter substrate-binding protein [Chloroflexia bacterium]
MGNPKSTFLRSALYLGVAGSMITGMMPLAARPVSAQGTSRKIGDYDVAGRFLEVWQAQGNDQSNTYVNGLPITARRAELSTEDGKSYDSQWFERAKYEAHPENKAPYDVLLGRLGANFVEGRGSIDGTTGKVRNPADAPFVKIAQPGDLSATKLFFPESGHSVSGKILEYWKRYGGLTQFGYPLSEAFNEASTDGKTYSTQYFERARFEVHPEKAAPYEVELGLLGVQQYKATPIAADKLPIAPPSGVTSSKDTFADGSLQEPDTMFCNEAGTVVAVRFCAAVTFNDGLVALDDKENFFPLAAWYVPTIENGGSFYVGTGDDRHLITKFKLRKGIKWSDGVELTSADAVYSYKLILDDPFSASVSLQQKVSSVDNPDKYTVVYNWMSLREAKAKLADAKTDKSAYAFLQTFIDLGRPVVDNNYLLIGSVHPKHLLEKIPIDKIQESSEGQKPTGYGPYIVSEWKQGETMTLIKNPNYNLTSPPLINRIIAKFNPDVNAQVNAYLTGQIDGIASEGFVVVPDQTDQITAAGGTVVSQVAASWEHLDPYFEYGPFKDIKVRQALIYGINRQQIVNVVFKGKSAVLDSPVPSSVFHSLANPDFAKNFPELAAKYKLPVYAFDQAKANQLLDQAGWVKGADGIRAKNGEKLSFEYATTRNVTRQAIQVLVANDLKALGIDAQVVNYPTGFFNPEGPIATGKCKLCEFAFTQTSTSNFDTWDWGQRVTQDNPGNPNRQQYNNQKVTDANAVFKAELERTKVAEQSALIQVEMMNDVAVIPLVSRPIIEIYTSKMMNRKTTNSSAPQWWNAAQWYFK